MYREELGFVTWIISEGYNKTYRAKLVNMRSKKQKWENEDLHSSILCDHSKPVLWNCHQTYCMISWVVTQHCRETRVQTNRMHCLTYSKIFGFLGSRFSHYKTSLKHTPEVHAVRAVSKHLCLWEASKHQCPHMIQAAHKSQFLDFNLHSFDPVLEENLS